MNLLDFLSEENRRKNTQWLDEKSRQFNQLLNSALPRNPNDKGHAIQPLTGLMEMISPATDIVDAQSSSEGLMNELSRGSKINALGQGARMLASLGSVALPGNLVRTYDDLSKNIVANFDKFKDVKVDPYRSKQRTWHGSPHDFDEFKINDDTIDGGEGNQAFGWGGYSSQSRNIAEEHYRNRLSDMEFTYKGKDYDTLFDEIDLVGGTDLSDDVWRDPGAFDTNFNNIHKHFGYHSGTMDDQAKYINHAFGNHSESLQRAIDLLTNAKYTDTNIPDYIKGSNLEAQYPAMRRGLKEEVSNLLTILDDPTINNILGVSPKYFGQGAKIKMYDNLEGNEEKIIDRLKGLQTNLSKMKPEDFELKSTGKLYEMEFDAELDELLDWDKPMSQQSDFVKKRIGNIIDELDTNNFADLGLDLDSLYRNVRHSSWFRDYKNQIAFGQSKESAVDFANSKRAMGDLPNMSGEDAIAIIDVFEEVESLSNIRRRAMDRLKNMPSKTDLDVQMLTQENEKITNLGNRIDNLLKEKYSPIAKRVVKGEWLGKRGDGYEADVSDFLGNMRAIRGEQNAGELASRDQGIRGIMYDAGGSRNPNMAEEDRIKNFVTFDDKHLEILKKYGLLAPLYLGGVGLLGDNDDRPY